MFTVLYVNKGIFICYAIVLPQPHLVVERKKEAIRIILGYTKLFWKTIGIFLQRDSDKDGFIIAPVLNSVECIWGALNVLWCALIPGKNVHHLRLTLTKLWTMLL